METSHEYELSGKYRIKTKNFLTVPELNCLYKIENTGSNTSSNMFIAVNERSGERQALSHEQVSSLNEFMEDTSETESVEEVEGSYTPAAVSTILAYDSTDQFTIVIPRGRKVDSRINTLGNKVKYLKFPMQREPMDIQASAFIGLPELVSAYIPPYVQSIGKDAFIGCINLEKLYCPSYLSNDLRQAINPPLINKLVTYYDKREISSDGDDDENTMTFATTHNGIKSMTASEDNVADNAEIQWICSELDDPTPSPISAICGDNYTAIFLSNYEYSVISDTLETDTYTISAYFRAEPVLSNIRFLTNGGQQSMFSYNEARLSDPSYKFGQKLSAEISSYCKKISSEIKTYSYKISYITGTAENGTPYKYQITPNAKIDDAIILAQEKYHKYVSEYSSLPADQVFHSTSLSVSELHFDYCQINYNIKIANLPYSCSIDCTPRYYCYLRSDWVKHDHIIKYTQPWISSLGQEHTDYAYDPLYDPSYDPYKVIRQRQHSPIKWNQDKDRHVISVSFSDIWSWFRDDWGQTERGDDFIYNFNYYDNIKLKEGAVKTTDISCDTHIALIQRKYNEPRDWGGYDIIDMTARRYERIKSDECKYCFKPGDKLP